LEHNISNKSAKYTRMRRPVVLIFSRKFSTKSEACVEEYRIKQLTRKQKEKLIKESY
jgi:putative endonuclease